MHTTKLLCGLVLTALSGVLAPALQAADEAVITQQMGVGNLLPANYTSPEAAIKNWKGARLKAPASGTQWVVIDTSYVRVRQSDGMILEIVQVPQ